MPGSRALLGVLAAVVVAAFGACSSGQQSGDRRPGSSVTTTSAPTPSTVSDRDFDNQATTTELMIRNAGSDPCAVIKAFAPSSAMPTPVNPTQTKRGVKVIVALFNAAASAAPPEASAEAAVLARAASDLLAEGEANNWQPAWLMKTPKAISEPDVTRAFSSYQSTVTKSCMTQAPTTTP